MVVGGCVVPRDRAAAVERAARSSEGLSTHLESERPEVGRGAESVPG